MGLDRDRAEPQVRELPGERARDRVEYHRSMAAPSTYVYEFVWDTTAPADGPFCTDADGNVLMDFTSHVGAAPLGYDNPKITDRMAAFDLPEPAKIAGQDFYATAGDPADVSYPGPAELMDRLTDTTEQYGLDTVFLSNSGAEAVENAMKICYDDGGKYAITFEGAFHGRTLGTLSLNRSKGVYRRAFPEVGPVQDAPFCMDRSCDRSTCECGFFTGADRPSKLARMLDPERGFVDPDEVAFLILEPVQGEGGYRIPSDPFMEEVAAVCERHDIALLADEIQSGVGRSGEVWASDHYPIEPDVITAAKGLRVGATVASEGTFPDQRSRLSSTWGAGDLVGSLQGALTLEAIQDHDLLDNATREGRSMQEHLRDADLPGATDVRGLGLLLAVEFDSKERRDEVQAAAMQRGLLTLACGHRTLRLLPPLDVTEREVALGADLLADAVRDVA